MRLTVFFAALVACLTISPTPTAAVGAPQLPSGFRVDIYVAGLSRPTAMAFGPDGRLYVSEQDGHIVAIGEHRITTVSSGFNTPLSLAWYRNRLYVSSTGQVSELTPSAGFGHFSRSAIVSGLPYGRHQNDGLAFRGDWMYLGVGSTCDACRERDTRSATIMRFRPDGSHPQVFARGLRNPFGLAVAPGSGKLYATDNGRDDHDDQVPDELNRIIQGRSYGWPNCWGDGGRSDCRGTVPPVVALAPHASADGLCFYTGTTFPSVYRGDIFIAEWGATVGRADTGHRVVAVHLRGRRVTAQDFATGLDHPIAVAGARDGSLLIADWGTGTIWHVQASNVPG